MERITVKEVKATGSGFKAVIYFDGKKCAEGEIHDASSYSDFKWTSQSVQKKVQAYVSSLESPYGFEIDLAYVLHKKCNEVFFT